MQKSIFTRVAGFLCLLITCVNAHQFNFPEQAEVQVSRTAVVPFTNSGGATGRYEVSFVSGRESWMWASPLDTGNWETGEIRLAKPPTVGTYTVVFRSQEYQKPEAAIDRTIVISVTPNGDQGGDFEVNVDSLTSVNEGDSDSFRISAVPSGAAGSVSRTSITGGGDSQSARLIRANVGFNGFQLTYENAPLLLVQQTTTFGPFTANFTDSQGNTASDTFSIRIVHDPAVGTPDAPVLNGVSSDNDAGTALIDWEPVFDDEPVNWYSVRFFRSGALVAEKFPNPLVKSSLDVVVGGEFERGVDYEVKVSAHNRRGFGLESNSKILRWSSLPEITGFTPSTLEQGSTARDVYITGRHFEAGRNYRAWLGAGVFLEGADASGAAPAYRVSDTKLRVEVTSVASDAALGAREVHVNYGGEEALVLSNGFSIIEAIPGGGGIGDVSLTFIESPAGVVERGGSYPVSLSIQHPAGIRSVRAELVKAADPSSSVEVLSLLMENKPSAMVTFGLSVPNHLETAGYQLRVLVESDGEPANSTFFSPEFQLADDSVSGSFVDFDGHLFGNPTANGMATPEIGLGVNAINGNFFTQEVDAGVRGKGIDFVFTRFFNSLLPDVGSLGQTIQHSLGKGWRHSFQIDLAVVGDEAEVVWQSGRRDGFTKTNGIWSGVTPGNFQTLEELPTGWQLVTPNKSKFRFDSQGRLASASERNGGEITLAYQASSIVITDSCGRDAVLSLDGAQRVAGLTLSDGKTTSYRYDSVFGVLLGATDRNGKERRFLYNDSQLRRVLFRGKTHENHAVVSLTYDAEGRVLSQQTGLQLVTDQAGAYSFDWQADETILTTPAARKLRVVKDAFGRATGLETWEPPGETSTTLVGYARDSGRNMLQATSLTDAEGGLSQFTFSGPFQESVSPPVGEGLEFDWDTERGVPSSVTAASGLTVSNTTFDERGNPLGATFTQPSSVDSALSPDLNVGKNYDLEGLLDSLDVNGSTRTEVVARHPVLGLPTLIRYPVSDSASIEVTKVYDASSRLIQESVTGGLNTYYFYDANDNLTDRVSGSGSYNRNSFASSSVQHTRVDYDEENRAVEFTEAWGSSFAATSRRIYNDIGLLFKTEPSSGRTEEYRYNLDGEVEVTKTEPGYESQLYRQDSGRVTNMHLVKTQNDSQSDSTPARFFGSKRDRNGREIESYYGTSIDAATGEMNGKTRLSQVRYDFLGRPLSVTEFLSADETEYRVMSYSYSSDGRVTTQSWAGAPEVKEVEADGFGRIIRVTQRLGNDSVTVKARYDEEGRLAATIEPSGRETTYEYDRLGRMIAQTDIRGRVTWSYDDLQRTVTRSNPDSSWVKNTNDVFGRMIALSASDGLNFSFSYDPRSRISSEDWGTGSRSYSYTGDFQSAVTTIFSDGSSQTIDYDWDRDRSRLKSRTYGGRKLDYSYNLFDQNTGIDVASSSGGASLGEFSFDYSSDLGRLIGTSFPNGIQTDYQFNLAGDLTLQKTYRPGQQANPFLSYGLTLDSLGRRIDFDVTQPQAEDFPDEVVNLTHSSGVLSAVNGQGVLSDGRKNLTFLPYPSPTTLDYDVLDRVTSINGDVLRYDGARNWIEKGSGDSRTAVLKEVGIGLPQPLASLDSASSPSAIHIYGPQGLLGTLGDEDNWQIAHQDTRMNVVAVTATDQSLVGQFAYSPYGRRLSGGDASDYEFGFSGGLGHFSPSDHQISMNARLYLPYVGQFSSGDLIPGSLTRMGSLARYGYVSGDPLNSNDPTGLFGVSFSQAHDGVNHTANVIEGVAILKRTNAYKTPFKGLRGKKNVSGNLRGLIRTGQGGRAQQANRVLAGVDKLDTLSSYVDYGEAFFSEMPTAEANTSHSLGLTEGNITSEEALAAVVATGLESASYGVVRHNLKEFNFIGVDSEVIFSDVEAWHSSVDANFNIDAAWTTLYSPVETWKGFKGELHTEFGDGQWKAKSANVVRRGTTKAQREANRAWRFFDLTNHF